MDRILRASKPAQAKKNEGARLLFPGAHAWELWTGSDKALASGQLDFESTTEMEVCRSQLTSQSLVAVPLRHVVVIPLWLATTDRSLLPDMIWLQLERRGLLTGSRDETVMDYRLIREESGRVLVSVKVLSGTFPQELCFKQVARYCLSLDLVVLPPDQLIFWKELDHLVFLFTSGPEAVYLQTSASISINDSVVQEALCARLQLESEGILTTWSGVTIWGRAGREERDLIARSFGAAVIVQDRPDLVKPTSPHQMIPQTVRAALEVGKKNRASYRVMGGIAVFYLCLLLAVFAHYGWLYWQKKHLDQDLALHRVEVETIRTTALRWESVELALLPEMYPLEMLFRCTRALPEEGVRLVTFDQSGTRVLMTGEAKNSAAAFQFLQDLKKKEDLSMYQWEMPPPKLLPTDAAQFQIEGKRSYARTN
jgi:hypothetical protein